jgi:sugar lactone lactonase YvrE
MEDVPGKLRPMRCRWGILASCAALSLGCSSAPQISFFGDAGSEDDSTAADGSSGGSPDDATTADAPSSDGPSPETSPAGDGAMDAFSSDAVEDGGADALSDGGGSADSTLGEAATPDAPSGDTGSSDAPSGIDSTMGDSATDGGAGDTTVPGQDGGPDAAGDAPTADAAADAPTSDAAADSPPTDAGADAPTGDATLADAAPLDAALPDSAADGGEAASPPPKIVTYVPGITVSTVAGGSSYGDVDGPDASFANPTGIALYGADGLIVVENDTGAIRTISATGVATTVGMSPVDRQQTSPFAIVAGPQGGYYYSTDFDETGLHVDGGGAVWTFVPDDAGGGASTLVAGGLYLPRTLVPLPGGNVFVLDTGATPFSPVTEDIAELLDPGTGALTPIAGQQGQNGFANADGGAALFGASNVGGVLLPDGSGVVVADCSNNQLRLVALGGSVSTYAGSTTAGWVDGPRASALFSCPHALAIDALGNIYVSDGGNSAIRMVAVDGTVTTLAGNGTQGYAEGTGDAAEFYGAEGLIVSADGTTLFIADGTLGNGALPYNHIRRIALPVPDGG